jgi:hypothetical protein
MRVERARSRTYVLYAVGTTVNVEMNTEIENENEK